MTRAEPPTPEDDRPITFIGEHPLGIEEVLALARGHHRAALDPAPACRARIRRSAEMLRAMLAADDRVYGVTTGVGDSVTTTIPASLADQLPLNLLRFHGCGTGPPLDELEAAAVIAVRLASLARGFSGVREVVIERLCEHLDRRILPRIPARGSVGASGDLTPLSYVAAMLVGEREVTVAGQELPAATALAAAGLEPLRLQAKESLAVMNGTAVTTALACVAWERARRLARFAAALTAGVSDVTRGNPAHFEARIFALKPHPGQVTAARWIREDVELATANRRRPDRLQDRYSVRCAPHVIGVLVDALTATRTVLEIEINSINDNPILDPESGTVLHGGNFYGGHVGHAMDGLKAAVANIADLIDRQVQLLCDPATSGGLPANLVAATGAARVVHHGFKAAGIATSAVAAEALKLSIPASVFSRSTESHNQDKVPMATMAARDCLQILDLTETVAAIGALAVCQGVDLRGGEGCYLRARALHAAIRETVPTVSEDRRMDHDIDVVLALLRAGQLPLGDEAIA